MEEKRQEREGTINKEKGGEIFSLKQGVVGKKACDWRRG